LHRFPNSTRGIRHTCILVHLIHVHNTCTLASFAALRPSPRADAIRGHPKHHPSR
jgi:hypothetical protein